MLEKYVEEQYPRLMTFGRSPNDPNFVGVCDSNDTIDLLMEKSDAEKLVVYQNRLIDLIAKMADAFDKADAEKFKKFWYEDRVR